MAQQEKKILQRWYLFNLSSRIKRIESGCRNVFDAIVAITEDDRKWFEAQGGNSPVIVSETGADLTVMAKKKPTGDYKVGFIGALDWQPNIDGLLWFLKEVWPGIVDAIPQASLYIAGKNASPHLCKTITGSHVVFRGEIDDAVTFTSSMTVIIAPLFAGSGMRIKIIEAMNAGTPVVASPVAAKGLPVTDRKDILLGKTRDEFQNAIAELLTDSITREKIAFNAKALIRERFNNDKLTGRLLEFYKTLQDDR